MGDRSYVSLTFGHIDEQDAEAVAAFVEAKGMASDWDNSFYHEEAYLGTAEDYHLELLNVAPHSPWSVSQDPRYEFAGWTYFYAPGLGVFDTETNSDGVLLFNTADVEEIWGTTREERDRRLGKPWLEAMAAGA